MTTKANIVNLNGVVDLEEWSQNENHVYVGRPKQTISNAIDWGNPHRLRDGYNRREALDLYRQHVLNTKHLAQAVGELHGKVLGCWCAPELCHAEVLHEMSGNCPIYQTEEMNGSYAAAAGDYSAILNDMSETVLSLDHSMITERSRQEDHSAILQELSETIANSPHGYYEATHELIEDINNKRIFEPVKPKKRTGKSKELLEEEFSFNVYKINQAGFTTMNPKIWAIGIEHYAKLAPDVSFKWQNKMNEDEKVTHARIYIWYEKIKPIIVTINYIQGLVIVSGATFKTWIEQEFSKVTRNMDECIKKKILASTESLQETKTAHPGRDDPSCSKTQKDIDALSDECNDLRNSLKIMDNSNLELTNRINELLNKSKDEAIKLETRLDVKITEFTQAIEKEIEKRITTKIKTVESTLHSIRTEFTRLKAEIAEKIEELTSLPLNDIKTLQMETSATNKRLSDIDFKGLTESYTTERDARDEDFKTLTKKLEQLQEHFDDHTESLGSYHIKQTQKQNKYETEIQCLQQSMSDILNNNNNSNNKDNSNSNNSNNNSNSNSSNSNSNINKNNKHSNSNKNKNNNNNNTNNTNRNTDTDIIMCFDSNRKFINFRKLWTLKGTKRRKSGNLASVKMAVEREKATNVKYFLISVGTNDIDEKEPDAILHEYVEIVDCLRRKYPGIKVIINQLPPRKTNNDEKVQAVNMLLADLCDHNDFLYLVNQDRLRNDIDRNMYDDKHIHRRAFYIFAGNIKRTLRKAYGIPEPERDDTIRRP